MQNATAPGGLQRCKVPKLDRARLRSLLRSTRISKLGLGMVQPPRLTNNDDGGEQFGTVALAPQPLNQLIMKLWVTNLNGL